MLFRALSRCLWNTARVGIPTFSPGRLFQGYITCSITKVCWCQCLFFVLMHLWSQILPLANQRGAHLLPLHFPAFGSCREEQGCCPSSSFTPKYKPVTPAAPHGTCLHWTHPPLVVGPQCSQHSRWDHTVAKYSILVLL